MGRPKLKLDNIAILQMRSQGKHIKHISKDLGVSERTLSRRIAELRNKEGLLTKFRELQGLKLTELQFTALKAITPERMEGSSLLDLVKCFSILDKAQRAIEGKEPGFKLRGSLLDHLLEMEKMKS